MLFPVGSPSHSKPVTQQLETDIASAFVVQEVDRTKKESGAPTVAKVGKLLITCARDKRLVKIVVHR
jgi:hypothetical protein